MSTPDLFSDKYGNPIDRIEFQVYGENSGTDQNKDSLPKNQKYTEQKMLQRQTTEHKREIFHSLRKTESEMMREVAHKLLQPWRI